MSNATRYYEAYNEHNAYRMATVGKSSRIAYLMDYIRKHTPVNGCILDVGCGDMYLSTLLPEYQWVGIDINDTQSDGKAIKHNLEKFPYPLESSSFDTIVCSEVLEHMFDPVGITKEIRRVIKDTGTYILSTPNYSFLDHYLQFGTQVVSDLTKPWTYEHIRQYTYASHEQILDASKFKIVEFTGADAQFSQFYCQGRAALKSHLESLGQLDTDYVITDKLIGAMFPLHNHTIMLVTKPV